MLRKVGLMSGIVIVALMVGAIFLWIVGKSIRNGPDEQERVSYNKLPLAKNAEALNGPLWTGEQLAEGFSWLWSCDFKGDQIRAVDHEGKIIWTQQMDSSPIPPESYATNTEYVTVVPNGNIIVADGDGMMVQEIDRQTHRLVWQYGVKDKQDYAGGQLHQPDKSFKINDHEVLINDGNNRRVIIVDQNTNKVVWQYGQTRKMGWGPNLLRGNTAVFPVDGGIKFLITDTLEKKVILVNRATKEIEHQWSIPFMKWPQHVWPTDGGGLVMEDRQGNKVVEIDRDGQIVWELSEYEGGVSVKYPTDVIKLTSGNVLIAEAGRGRAVEVEPTTGKIVWSVGGLGFVTTIAVEQ